MLAWLPRLSTTDPRSVRVARVASRRSFFSSSLFSNVLSVGIVANVSSASSVYFLLASAS